MAMNFYNYLKEHDINLTQQQHLAVNETDGAVLLLAVPGSGKTTVLVARLGFMIYEKRVPPEQILTLTYTVAATRDMAERFRSLFGPEYADRLEFRTINGVCARIINYFGKKIGKSAFNLVTDDKMTSELLGTIYRSVQNEFATESDLKNVRTLITYIKNMMLDSEEIKALDDTSEMKISEIYRMYQEEMRTRGLMDYDDQMVYALMILKRSTETLDYFQSKYPYILVDEAQDTSKIQHAIISLLAEKSGNLFMVGDEDQSIYGFRAAYPDALLNFEKEHKNARVLLMEENFRSRKFIVDSAEHFISQNVLRHKKTMFTKRSGKGAINTISIKSRSAQYSYLMKAAKDCRTETAVLYRDNESILPLVDLLERNNIPYRVKNMDLSFFSHRTVNDISNIIKFAADPGNDELFFQIYYKMKTYLSKALAAEACQQARKHELSIIDAALSFCKLPKGTETNLLELRANLKNLLDDKADQAIGRITRQMGYNEYLERNKISESKLFILKSLSYQEDSPLNLLERLKDLQIILKEKNSDPECSFILSTIHSSKGLEYDTVYLMDVMDGIFPQEVPDIAWKSSSIRKAASGDDREQLEIFEEERRLFYVAVTRAKNNLNIFEYKNEDATFLNELLDRGYNHSPSHSPGSGFSANVSAGNQYRSFSFGSGIGFGNNDRPKTGFGQLFTENSGYSRNNSRYSLFTPHAYSERNTESEKIFSESDYRDFVDSLYKGVRVKHIKNGEGTVVSIDKRKVTIAFDSGKEATFQLMFLYSHDLLKLL
ncbi:ATP-dependent helicase [Oribacterium sp. P6A1]|uniref:ATP-dependent helicase n=1 Tax=Oribacterium sp. P6A1 TaxID=1410612 RepID=UPI001FA6D013|nr:ATP-dependent helicase [Oribacterium sp. P6A1]